MNGGAQNTSELNIRATKSMKTKFASILIGILSAALVCGSAQAQDAKKLLVVTVTKGFRHSSIPTAEKILEKLSKPGGFTLDFVRNDEDMKTKMTADNLKQYDGFIFANTTGVLPLPDKEAFLNEIRNGKAFIGMHSASDTFHGDKEVDPYTKMLGGEFQTHGAQVGVECLVRDSKHPATKHLGKAFVILQEEMYLLKNYDPSTVPELLVLDKHPNEKTPGHFPVAWCKEVGKGKVFYTSLGHREDIWDSETDPKFKRENPTRTSDAYNKHILGGIRWALGLEPGDATPQKN
jgi:uncharacterized protein